MFQIHPDDAHSSVQLRQFIVRQGMAAARRPGDLAAIRERAGTLLIALGERLQGRQPARPSRALNPAHERHALRGARTA